MTSPTSVPRLSALDRCDRCGAQAFVQVELASGDLLFCVHHAREYEDVLRDIALVIKDESGRLGQTPLLLAHH